MNKTLALIGAGLGALGVLLLARRAKAAPPTPPPGLPPSGLANVYGKVTLATTGAPLQDTTVELGNGIYKTAETDANGDYWILNIGHGTYRMAFSLEGTEPLVKTVSLQEGNNRVDASLVPLEVPPPIPPPIPPPPVLKAIDVGKVEVVGVNGQPFVETGIGNFVTGRRSWRNFTVKQKNLIRAYPDSGGWWIATFKGTISGEEGWLGPGMASMDAHFPEIGAIPESGVLDLYISSPTSEDKVLVLSFDLEVADGLVFTVDFLARTIVLEPYREYWVETKAFPYGTLASPVQLSKSGGFTIHFRNKTVSFDKREVVGLHAEGGLTVVLSPHQSDGPHYRGQQQAPFTDTSLEGAVSVDVLLERTEARSFPAGIYDAILYVGPLYWDGVWSKYAEFAIKNLAYYYE